MILQFDAQRVRKLVEPAENAPKHTKSYFDKSDLVPALVLVGSDGVDLASSGISQPLDDVAIGGEPYVAHAEGINPKGTISMTGGNASVSPLAAMTTSIGSPGIGSNPTSVGSISVQMSRRYTLVRFQSPKPIQSKTVRGRKEFFYETVSI